MSRRASEARGLSIRARREATNDFERFLAADSVARHLGEAAERLTWLQTALDLASRIDNEAVRPAFAALHSAIAECHEALGDLELAERHGALAGSGGEAPSDRGPFYHGTKADLQVGDLLTAGRTSNYDAGLAMNHVYFTALVHGAGLAASLANGDGRERVYVVEPSGSFEDDPHDEQEVPRKSHAFISYRCTVEDRRRSHGLGPAESRRSPEVA